MNLMLTFHTSFYEYKITFVNSQHENTNSKGDLILKNRFLTVGLKIYDIQN